MSGRLRSAILLLLAGSVLSACSSDEFTDLDEFMQEKLARPGGVIAPIPPFKAYKAFSYSATTLRHRNLSACRIRSRIGGRARRLTDAY